MPTVTDRAHRLRSAGISFLVTPEAKKHWELVLQYYRKQDTTGARKFEEWLAKEYARILRDAKTKPWVRHLVRRVCGEDA